MLNVSLKKFKDLHKKNNNQIVFSSLKTSGEKEIINLINNFLIEKNSFIFESVEKGLIKGRYTIFGKNPDKIWEFNNKSSYIIKKNKKIKLKEKPETLIEKIIEDFKFDFFFILNQIRIIILKFPYLIRIFSKYSVSSLNFTLFN